MGRTRKLPPAQTNSWTGPITGNADQRADAKTVYQAVIDRAAASPRMKRHDIAKLWNDIRLHWGGSDAAKTPKEEVIATSRLLKNSIYATILA